jgi:hypothetical protein
MDILRGARDHHRGLITHESGSSFGGLANKQNHWQRSPDLQGSTKSTPMYEPPP